DGTVRVWDPGGQAEPVVLTGHEGGVWVAVGRAAGREVIVSGGGDGTVRVWDPGGQAEPVVLTGHEGGVSSVAVGRAAGREVIVSGGGDRAVLLWLPRERSSAGRRHSRF